MRNLKSFDMKTNYVQQEILLMMGTTFSIRQWCEKDPGKQNDLTEKENLGKIFGKKAIIKFKQSPQDKLDYISRLKRNDIDAEILMLGDGLNDAGALK